MEMGKQVFVGGVEGLQRFVGHFRLADQVELGEGGGKSRHGR